jgi:hypothetical protein
MGLPPVVPLAVWSSGRLASDAELATAHRDVAVSPEANSEVIGGRRVEPSPAELAGARHVPHAR